MSYKNVADVELWELCRQGNIWGYNELFRRYYPRMLRLASHYISDTMVAEELCMDQMFNLWAKRESITIKDNLSSYIFCSIRNLIVSHLRKNIPVTAGIEELEKISTYELSDQHLLSEEIKTAYHKALKKLSPQRYKAFVLSRMENMSYPEIAKRMNLSVNTVENYMGAALNSLRESMKEYLPSVISLFVSGCFLSTFQFF